MNAIVTPLNQAAIPDLIALTKTKALAKTHRVAGLRQHMAGTNDGVFQLLPRA